MNSFFAHIMSTYDIDIKSQNSNFVIYHTPIKDIYIDEIIAPTWSNMCYFDIKVDGFKYRTDRPYYGKFYKFKPNMKIKLTIIKKNKIIFSIIIISNQHMKKLCKQTFTFSPPNTSIKIKINRKAISKLASNVEIKSFIFYILNKFDIKTITDSKIIIL